MRRQRRRRGYSISVRATTHQALRLCGSRPENHAPSYAALGSIRILAGHPEQSHAFLDRALAISPLDPLRAVWYQYHSTAFLQQGDDTSALRAAQEAIAANPAYSGGYLNTAVALAHLGRREEAVAALNKHNQLRPGCIITKLERSATISASPAAVTLSTRIFDTLRDLGLPDH